MNSTKIHFFKNLYRSDKEAYYAKVKEFAKTQVKSFN